MARILLSAPANKPWVQHESHLCAALQSLGHDARLVDFRSARRPDRAVRVAADRFDPELHVIYKGEVYGPETIRALSERGIYTVVWHSDANVPAWLPPLAGAADLCCVQSAGMIDELKAAGVGDPQWLMEGITPECFPNDGPTDRDREKFGCDVTLVGTVGRRPDYDRRSRLLDRLINEGFRVRWWGRRPGRRFGVLTDRSTPVARAWSGRVWNETYAMACRCAKIFLAVPSRPEVTGGLSDRAFIATGLGAFYLSLYRRGIEEFFEPDREIVVFHDADEMVEKVRYYLAHDGEREAIAAAGRRRTLANHTNQHAFRRLFTLVAAHGGPRI